MSDLFIEYANAVKTTAMMGQSLRNIRRMCIDNGMPESHGHNDMCLWIEERLNTLRLVERGVHRDLAEKLQRAFGIDDYEWLVESILNDRQILHAIENRLMRVNLQTLLDDEEELT